MIYILVNIISKYIYIYLIVFKSLRDENRPHPGNRTERGNKGVYLANL